MDNQTSAFDWLRLEERWDITPITFVPFCLIYVQTMIGGHILNWTKPREQMRILVIIFMPLVVCMTSLFALQANEENKTLFMVLDSIKDCYVGLGLAMFLSLMHTYMDLNSTDISSTDFRVKIGGRVISNVFPVTLFQPRHVLLNQNSLKGHKYWAWQFVVIRLVCSLFMIVLQLLDMYHVWLTWAFLFIINVSVSLAFYTVFAFYQAFFKDFARHDIFTKFLCLKGVVAVCFCQGGVVKVLEAAGIIKSNSFWGQELHNNLLILEMMFLTIVQWHAYSFKPYAHPKPVSAPADHDEPRG